MKKKNNPINVFDIICAVLMLALVVCLFMPFWTVGTESISMQEYIWMPEANEAFTDYFQDAIHKDFRVNDVTLVPIFVLVSGVLGAYFCLIKRSKLGACVCTLCCGIIGMIGFLTSPAMQMGAYWQVYLALSIVVTAFGVFMAVQCIKRAIAWCICADTTSNAA